MGIDGIMWEFIKTLAELERSGEDLLPLLSLIEARAALTGGEQE